MKKKIVFLLFWFLSLFWGVFAISSGEILIKINLLKSYFLSQGSWYFDKIQKDTLEKIQRWLVSIYSWEDVKILLALWKVEKINLDNKFVNDLLNIKDNFLTDLIKEKNKLSLLEEKKRYNLITWMDYINQLLTIDFEVSTLSGKYTNLLSWLQNLYLVKLSQLSGKVKKLILNNQGLLSVVKKREGQLRDFVNKCNEFEQIYNRINELFLGAYGDYITFLTNFEEKYKKILNNFLDNLINNIYLKNKNFKWYGSWFLDSYKNQLIDSSLKKVEDYFDSLLNIWVDKNKINWVIQTKQLVYKKYYNWNEYNWVALAEDDYISKVYNKFTKTVDLLIDKFNQKLAEYDFPNTKNEISRILKKKLEEYIKNQIEDIKKDFLNYIDSLRPYIQQQVEKAKEIYNKIWDSYYKCETYTWDEKCDCLKSLQDDIIRSGKIVKDPKKNKLLEKLFWQIEVEKVDCLIKKKGIEYFNLKYKKIDETLNKILDEIYNRFKDKWQEDLFRKKLKKWLEKIDNLLNSWVDLTEETEYLLLKIKKAFIKFLYLKE